MPEEGVEYKQHHEILPFEEIIEVIKTGVTLGIDKIRFTGGEPLVRKDFIDLVAGVAAIDGIKDLALTTNGVLLPGMAKDLKAAGLQRVNISLDTLDPEKFRQITRTGDLDSVLAGIEAALAHGLDPVKINFVRLKGLNEEDESEVRDFCKRNGLQLRFIRQMNLSKGEFYAVEGGEGGICARCNRLRLTADGYIVPCLFSDHGFSVQEMGAREAFFKALGKKPLEGSRANTRSFYNIGG
jgi:cyclic pyranopterin phosphate synthase